MDGSEANLRNEVEEFYEIVGDRCKIDIFECARVDPQRPVEETVAALAKLVEEGKIGGVGLSECGASTIRRAAKVTKIASVEVEFSIFTPDILTNGVADTCAELGIPIVGYSPFSRGLLTGEIRTLGDLPEDDMRRNYPRFQPENFSKNIELVDVIVDMAKSKGCAPSNIALAWIHSKSGHPAEVIPIPGTTTVSRLEENMGKVSLSAEDLKNLDQSAGRAAGDRYPAFLQSLSWA